MSPCIVVGQNLQKESSQFIMDSR